MILSGVSLQLIGRHDEALRNNAICPIYFLKHRCNANNTSVNMLLAHMLISFLYALSLSLQNVAKSQGSSFNIEAFETLK